MSQLSLLTPAVRVKLSSLNSSFKKKAFALATVTLLFEDRPGLEPTVNALSVPACQSAVSYHCIRSSESSVER